MCAWHGMVWYVYGMCICFILPWSPLRQSGQGRCGLGLLSAMTMAMAVRCCMMMFISALVSDLLVLSLWPCKYSYQCNMNSENQDARILKTSSWRRVIYQGSSGPVRAILSAVVVPGIYTSLLYLYEVQLRLPACLLSDGSAVGQLTFVYCHAWCACVCILIWL